MKPNFMDRIAKIVVEVRNRTCIDNTEVLEEILKYEFRAYYAELEEHYEEEYCIAISRARNSAYYDGHSDGYDIGYDDGRSGV